MIVALLILSMALPPEVNSSRFSNESALKGKISTREVILEKAMESLSQRYDPQAYRFQLSVRWIPRHVLQAAPSDIEHVSIQGEVSRYTNFKVSVHNNDRAEETEIQLSVDIERKLPVLNKRLQSGSVVASEDISIRWIPVRAIEQIVAERSDELAGKTLRNTIVAGEAVRLNQLTSKILVEAGDPVQLIFEDSGVRIVISGEARQSGAADDEISIYSKETRKTYRGRITSPGITKWINTR